MSGIHSRKYIVVIKVDTCTRPFVAAVNQSSFFAVFRTRSPNLHTFCGERGKETEAIRLISSRCAMKLKF